MVKVIKGRAGVGIRGSSSMRVVVVGRRTRMSRVFCLCLHVRLCVCVRVCVSVCGFVRLCVRPCVRASMRAHVCERATSASSSNGSIRRTGRQRRKDDDECVFARERNSEKVIVVD